MDNNKIEKKALSSLLLPFAIVVYLSLTDPKSINTWGTTMLFFYIVFMSNYLSLKIDSLKELYLKSMV